MQIGEQKMEILLLLKLCHIIEIEHEEDATTYESTIPILFLSTTKAHTRLAELAAEDYINHYA